MLAFMYSDASSRLFVHVFADFHNIWKFMQFTGSESKVFISM